MQQQTSSFLQIVMISVFDDEIADMQSRQVQINHHQIRQRESSSICATKDKIYLFGGTIDSIFFNQMFCYDLATQTWQRLQTTGQRPSPRCLSALKYCQQTHSIYLYGGEYQQIGSIQQDGAEQLIDFYVFDINTNHWTFLTVLPLFLADMYFSNQLHLVYPYLYLPTNQQQMSNGVYQYSITSKQWKFLPFDCLLYLDIENTLIINGYLYILGKQIKDEKVYKVWKCNLNSKNKLKLELYPISGISGIHKMKFVNFCAYKDMFYLFSQAKTNQMVAVDTQTNIHSVCSVGCRMLCLWLTGSCMLGSCVISLYQLENNAKFVYFNLYRQPNLSRCTFYPIPIEYYPNIRVNINGVCFMASKGRLASNSKLFSMLLANSPQEIQLRVVEVSRMAIDKLMATLMEEYIKQEVSSMTFSDIQTYLMELAYLGQYFIVDTLTKQVDCRLCDLLSFFDPLRAVETIRMAQSLDLQLFAQLSTWRLIKLYISQNRVEQLLNGCQSRTMIKMIAQHKFDLIHRSCSQKVSRCQ